MTGSVMVMAMMAPQIRLRNRRQNSRSENLKVPMRRPSNKGLGKKALYQDGFMITNPDDLSLAL